jgi:hypothetical protein
LSRQKSAARAAAERKLLRSLLRHGARFLSPDARLLEEAVRLADLGLVDLQRRKTVRCANPLDADFPPPDPTCEGLIGLRKDADEGGGDYRCPRCERIVYPDADRKRVFDGVVVHLNQTGIEAFLIEQCGDLAAGKAFDDGVLRVSIRGINAFVCLIDYCNDDPWRRHSMAVGQPCVYVTIEDDRAAGFIDDQAIARVALADLLLGPKDLRAALNDRATTRPAQASNIDISVYALGTRTIPATRQDESKGRRIFHLWLSPAGLLVDGLLAIRAERFRAIGIMRVLLQRFADAAAAGRPVRPISAENLADDVQKVTGGTHDESTIRRTLVRMRNDIAATVRRRTGEAIGDHDIIDTMSRSGANRDAEGYRLNPMTVALGPFEA